MENNDIYPNIKFDENNLNNGGLNLQKILPLLISGKSIGEILPNMFGSNPLIANLLNMNKNTNVHTKIESDTIDVNSLHKVN